MNKTKLLNHKANQMKKFNMSLIMKNAWKFFKSQDVRTMEIFSDCLKKSWAIAKSAPLFADIYRKYYSDLLRYVNSKIRNSEDAEELTNDIFVKANKHLQSYNPDMSQINTWLYKIANCAIIDRHRTDHSDKLINTSDFVDSETGEEIFQFVDNSETTDDIENTELSTKISKAFNVLSPNYRKVAILYFTKELKYKEIAELCQIPMGTVKGILVRARKLLQSELKGELITA
jgi:RNA polymerase sigma-70 factor (ECF subfamily)